MSSGTCITDVLSNGNPALELTTSIHKATVTRAYHVMSGHTMGICTFVLLIISKVIV